MFHAVADEGVPTREIAEIIGRHLGVPAVSVAREDAAEHFGWMGVFFGLDAPASSALTQERLGWTPVQPGLVADLEQGHYFGPVARGERLIERSESARSYASDSTQTHASEVA